MQSLLTENITRILAIYNESRIKRLVYKARNWANIFANGFFIHVDETFFYIPPRYNVNIQILIAFLK